MPIRRSLPPRIKPLPGVGRAHRLGPRAGQELAIDGLRLPGARAADGRWRCGARPNPSSRPMSSKSISPAVRTVGEAATPYRPTDAQTAHHIARFVTLVRSLSIDPIVVRQNWLDAYDYTTDRGAAVLNDYARVNDPFARIGKESVTVQITSVVRASDASFNVRWMERRYVNGAAAGLERWTAVVSIVQQTPRTEERLRRNPLGIYVNGLSWSRELDSSEGVKP